MNERAAFLTAIRDQHNDDTPRLVFADWLDEHAENDRDVATAEFIRVSCLGRNHPTGYMPRKAYQWLHGNWMRLVPLTLGLHVRKWWIIHQDTAEVSSDIGWARNGREIEAHMRMHPKVGNGVVLHYRVNLEFNRGFLQWFDVLSNSVLERICNTVRTEQPLARLRTRLNRAALRG